MFRRITAGLILIAITLSVMACSGNNTQSLTPIKAKWITTKTVESTVSIPASEVESNKMTHFKFNTPNGDLAFMAYELGVEKHVRSNICPPCRSIGFSLKGDVLVCDTCATTFNAKTGEGITGACADFPKAAVPYKVIEGNMTMEGNTLLTAYQNTLKPGLP
ncbi:Fe-S-containing protein [Chloroflexota bacterium]